jgi:A/G-specific adenine glycosylase
MTAAFPDHLPVSRNDFCQGLLAWYQDHKRPLPWREDRDPYKIWIAEIMLQQTTVRAVVPYFRAFLENFPDVTSLALADESAVLALWAGLGYYNRARNLLKTARLIVKEHGGQFPQDYRSALALPGIGRYTAGAILSTAYDLPFAVLDGNVARVFSRYLGFEARFDSMAAKVLWKTLSQLVADEPARSRVADFNQGLMELGAIICTPRRPTCLKCPLSTGCAALTSGNQEAMPRKKVRRASIMMHFSIALVSKGQCLLMSRNQSEPFPRGLWEPPRVAGTPDQISEAFQSSCGLALRDFRTLGVVPHAITHHRLKIYVLQARLHLETGTAGFAWVDPRTPAAGVSSYVRKALRLQEGRDPSKPVVAPGGEDQSDGSDGSDATL